ncbi:PleD family two-component system response regulator [Burkholderia sp. SRS-W-2-2016]|uniref:response regulator n=1 Tax=Burkholderia sp. SRS-W-2-2016 TaxID=1926878 RepID=UPI00094B3BB8|nr:response regulator [Burkholderia sp. SRS-W-2-2016]
MCKVLLVDDDAQMRAALEAALSANGHAVAGAQDGLAALRAAVDRPPDIIVCDVNMPYLEGPDAMRILKALPRFRSVPVILMSGAELPDTRLARAQLRKPGFVDRLLELIDELTRQSARVAPQPAERPPILATANEGKWNPLLAAASLGPSGRTRCASSICRGIELMHAQAARIAHMRAAGISVEESEKLYERLVDSVASLVQCLPIEASFSTRRRGLRKSAAD